MRLTLFSVEHSLHAAKIKAGTQPRAGQRGDEHDPLDITVIITVGLDPADFGMTRDLFAELCIQPSNLTRSGHRTMLAIAWLFFREDFEDIHSASSLQSIAMNHLTHERPMTDAFALDLDRGLFTQRVKPILQRYLDLLDQPLTAIFDPAGTLWKPVRASDLAGWFAEGRPSKWRAKAWAEATSSSYSQSAWNPYAWVPHTTRTFLVML